MLVECLSPSLWLREEGEGKEVIKEDLSRYWRYRTQSARPKEGGHPKARHDVHEENTAMLEELMATTLNP